jgi:hypothetical protein
MTRLTQITIDPIISNYFALLLHRPKRKMRQKIIKMILSSDVNAPSVRACFHLTALSGWKLLLYNIISPYIRNFGI